MNRSQKRNSRQHWQQTLNSFYSSGLSGAAFCRKHNLTYTTFANWRQKLRKELQFQNDKAALSPSQSLFAKVERIEPEESVCAEGRAEVRFPNGVTLTLSELPSPEWLLHLGGAN